MPHPKCKCCDRTFVKRDDPDLCDGCSTAYAMAIADVAAYMRNCRHATGVALKIEAGHAKGCARKAGHA